MYVHKWRDIRDPPNCTGCSPREYLRTTPINVYVNSLPTAIKRSQLILYADDAVLLFAASTPLELQDALQKYFSLIVDWYTDNKLTLNVKKTKILLTGSKAMLSLFNDFEFSTDGRQLDRVSFFRYLVVVLDEKWN